MDASDSQPRRARNTEERGLLQGPWAGGSLLLGLATAHAWAVAGHLTTVWGDSGQVLHQVERFAAGEVPYRDFLVTSPPLGIWVVGLGARLLGTDLAPILVTTGGLYLACVAAFWMYVRRVTGPALALPTALVGLLFATALATLPGNPLPLGTYSLGSPVGFLALVLGALGALRFHTRRGWLVALGVGVACAACFLAKQDFWPPALVLLACVTFVAWRARDVRAAIALFAGFVAVASAGLAAIALGAGPGAVLPVLQGFGAAGDSGIWRLVPSWERLTQEVLVLGLLGSAALVALVLGGAAPRHTRRIGLGLGVVVVLSLGVHVGMAARLDARVRAEGLGPWPTALETALERRGRRGDGVGVVRADLEVLHHRLVRRPLPTLLPVVALLALLLGWRRLARAERQRLLALLALCLAARARRGFEFTGWEHALLELPVYVALARALSGEAGRRPLRIGLAGLAGVGLLLYWTHAPGPLTKQGPRPALASRRGTIHIRTKPAADLVWIGELLDARDPSGTRPLLTFGHNGGFQYFLERPNPTPNTYGLKVGLVPPEELLRQVREADPPFFLIDHIAYDRAGVPQGGLHLDRWEHPLRANAMLTFDRPYFDALAAGCRKIAERPEGKPYFTIYDCASPPVPGVPRD